MSKNIFITATGTDVGKTYVSALIIKKMRESGCNCGYFKPVLSGVIESEGKLIQSDPNFVLKTAKLDIPAEDCVSYWWKEAVSPHLAAERQGEIIDVNKIKSDFQRLKENYDYLLIEGAGGITCPLSLKTNKYLLSDLIKELKAPILIVADAGLGTINSTLLTVGYAMSRNIPVAGIVFNNYDSGNFMHRDNLKQTEYLTGVRVVSAIPHGACDIDLLEDLFKE